MKHNNKPSISTEICDIELLSHRSVDGELKLEFSLYRVTLCGLEVYLAASMNAKDSSKALREAAAEVIGYDGKSADTLFRKLVCGCVPPSTFHEIVSDLISEAELASIC